MVFKKDHFANAVGVVGVGVGQIKLAPELELYMPGCGKDPIL